MHFSEIAAFDRSVATEAGQIFAVIRDSRGDDVKTSERIATLATRDRVLVLKNSDGRSIHTSPTVSSDFLERASGGNSAPLNYRDYRWATFRDDPYTLQVGADLREINRLGWDILLGMLAAIPTVFLVVTLGGRWIARQALGPFETIREAAAGISIHNLNAFPNSLPVMRFRGWLRSSTGLWIGCNAASSKGSVSPLTLPIISGPRSLCCAQGLRSC